MTQSVCRVVASVIDGGKRVLDIGNGWGRTWDAAPAYLLPSILVISGIFIAYKARQVENNVYSNLKIAYIKSLKYTRMVQGITGNVICLLPTAVVIRELYIFVIKNISPKKFNTMDLVRLCTAVVVSFLAYVQIIEANMKLCQLSDRLRATRSLDEAKAIIDFFEKTYKNIESIDIHGMDNLEIVKYLVEEKGADVNAKGNLNNTPLHEVNNLEVARYLISKGANLNALNRYHTTPLTDNVSSSNYKNKELDVTNRVKILLACGADPYHKDGNGNSIYEMCKDLKGPNFRNRFQGVYELLGLVNKAE